MTAISSNPYEISFSDFKLVKSAQSRAVKGLLAHIIVIAASAFAIGISVYLLIDADIERWKTAPARYWVPAFLGFALLVVFYVTQPRAIRREYAGLGYEGNKYIWRCDSDNFFISSDAVTSTIRFDGLARVMETPRFFVFLPNEFQPTFLPKGALKNTADVYTIRELVKKAGVPIR